MIALRFFVSSQFISKGWMQASTMSAGAGWEKPSFQVTLFFPAAAPAAFFA
jgi:hypothetical protein